MKNEMLLRFDTEGKTTVSVLKPAGFARPKDQQQNAAMVVFDMACLCEAVCMMIHLADQQGIKPSADSLRDCIKHLEHGFADPDIKAFDTHPGL